MKKLLIIILIFLLFINVFIVNSLATCDFNYNGQDYQIKDYNEYHNKEGYKSHSFFIWHGNLTNSIKDVDILYIFNADVSNYTNLYVKPHKDNGVLSHVWGLYGTNSNQEDVFISRNCTVYYFKNNEWIFATDYGTLGTSYENFIFSNCDIKNSSGDIIHGSNAFKNPFFINSEEELASGKFDTLKIDAGSLDFYDDEFGLVLFDVTSNLIEIGSSGIPNFNPLKTFILNSKSDYFRTSNLDVYYEIPQSSLQIDISNGKKFMFCLVDLTDYSLYNSTTFTVGGLTEGEQIKNSQDIMNDKLDEQTNAIKENTETNKNIFEKIGEMLSYINPFSENFFVYKLIELLVDAIKSLFIPSNDFFDNYFTDLKDWFSDRLGFLFYPFDLIIDILNKILNVNFSKPIFNIPDINEPFTNTKLISATTFNLNSLLENGVFKTIHEIYLVCLDAFIIFELVNMFRRKYEEVTTK